MMTGYVIKRSEIDYVINCDAQGKGGYNVVPRILDPCNEYSIWDVDAYIAEHPEMLLDLTAIEAEKLAQRARAHRDNLLKETVDSVNPMRWEALSEEQKDAWRAYRQALLDVPQQEGFPTNIVWPIIPTNNNNTAQEVQA